MHPIDCANPPRDSRPQWLTSVRSLSEAFLVAAHGVDIIDWKEPSAGPLAAVPPATWETAAQSQDQIRLPMSAALGESESARQRCGDVPASFRWAKAGPSRTDEMTLTRLWSDLRDGLPSSVELVAVAYADHQRASCPDAATVFRLAAEEGIERVLIDTFSKDGVSSIDWIANQLPRLGRFARDNAMWWCLAGSIKLRQLESQTDDDVIEPDCYAVRGDICEGSRTDSLSPKRLRRWQQWIADGRVANRRGPRETLDR
ncbi:MAG: (5-formylfuran-3-yl)methyl phosphate synthase [Planctomycetota bacterium]